MKPMPIRVLIVDDSSMLCQVIKRHLLEGQVGPIAFYFAENGIDAEAVLQEQEILGEPIDILFLDWMMPKMTGVELLQKIRNVEKFKTKPSVIMVTAETNAEQINVCLEFKVSRYVIKPFTQQMIVDAFIDVLKNVNLGEVRRAV